MKDQASFFDKKKQTKLRDEALDNLEEHRTELIAIGRKIAIQMATLHGRTCGPQVMNEMRKRNVPGIDQVDPRFMGAIFRGGVGWKRVGYEPIGSHGGTVSIWEIDE